MLGGFLVALVVSITGRLVLSVGELTTLPAALEVVGLGMLPLGVVLVSQSSERREALWPQHHADAHRGRCSWLSRPA
jgi:hypothetical protein